MLLTEQSFAKFSAISYSINYLKNIALYRDDGLAIFKNVNGPNSEKIKKRFVNCLNHDLELTIQCNKKVANFVGVTEFRKLNIPYLPKRQQ